MNSIFLEFNLPNAATWFYFSLFLTVGLFFNFRRPFSLRNFDVLALFLLAPGFLILQEAHQILALANGWPKGDEHRESLTLAGERKLLYAYLILISATAYWFFRCLLDLGLVRKPYLPINLNDAGLAWLTGALFVSLMVVAIRKMPDVPPVGGKEPIAIVKVTESASAIVSSRNADLSKADTRFWVERGTALIGHLVIVLGLVMIGRFHFQEWDAGLGAACLYLLIPSTAYTVQQVHHVWPAIFLVGAVLAYRRPILAGMMIGIAAGSAFFPALLFPLWFGFYRGRGLGRFTFAFLFALICSLATTGIIIWWSGEFVSDHLRVALSLSDWQAWKRPRTESLWTGTHYAYRLPVFIAYIAFVIVTAFWPTPRHLGQVIAQSAAVVLGVQFWYADQGGVYATWYMPLILLMIFRPKLTDVRPPEIVPETDWVRGMIGKFRRKPVIS